MRTMILISAFLTLFVSCEKSTTSPVQLTGNWGLIQTELYTNGDLKGVSSSKEISTYYQFENCGEDNAKCQLMINEDGEEDTYDYVYNPSENKLIINGSNIYQIEVLSETSLVFYKDYAPHKSIYSFEKVE